MSDRQMIDPEEQREIAGGIQSLNSALRLLQVLAREGGPIALRDLARKCGIPTSKAHRYLASFSHAGLAQSDGTGRYDLGPAAMTIGLAALARRDTVNRTADALPALVRDTAMTALISILGHDGATIVRWQRAPSPIITSLGLGTVMPLLTSATGRAFLAFSPANLTDRLRTSELKLARQHPQLLADLDGGARSLARSVDALSEAIRANGYATVDGRFIPGLVAVAAPVLDWQGEAELVVTLIGTDPAAIRPDSRAIDQLIEFCRRFSMTAS